MCPTPSTPCSISFTINITVNEGDLSNTTKNYTFDYILFVVPINQTFFNVTPIPTTQPIYSINDIVVVNMNEYAQVLGPLVSMYAATSPGPYGVNVIDGDMHEFPLQQAEQIIGNGAVMVDRQLYYSN